MAGSWKGDLVPLGCRRLRDRRSLATLATTAVLALPIVIGSGAARAADDRAAPLLISTNASRDAAGVPPLRRASDLDDVAAKHAAVMASLDRLFHNPALTEQVSSWQIVGENVGVGPDLPSLHRAFLASPTHRANVLRPAFTEVGFGAAVSKGGELWVVEVFRRPIAATSLGSDGAVSPVSAHAPAPDAATATPPIAKVAPVTPRHRSQTSATVAHAERASAPPAPTSMPASAPPAPPAPPVSAVVPPVAPVEPVTPGGPAGATSLRTAPAPDARPLVGARELAVLAAMLWFAIASQLVRDLGQAGAAPHFAGVLGVVTPRRRVAGWTNG